MSSSSHTAPYRQAIKYIDTINPNRQAQQLQINTEPDPFGNATGKFLKLVGLPFSESPRHSIATATNTV